MIKWLHSALNLISIHCLLYLSCILSFDVYFNCIKSLLISFKAFVIKKTTKPTELQFWFPRRSLRMCFNVMLLHGRSTTGGETTVRTAHVSRKVILLLQVLGAFDTFLSRGKSRFVEQKMRIAPTQRGHQIGVDFLQIAFGSLTIDK